MKIATGILRSLKDLEGFKIEASDGDIGKVHDFFFDDEFWAIRYLVVDTGHWLPGRKVLLPPAVMDHPDWVERRFTVALTREQIRTSPDVDTARPVSRQRELELHAHYGWPFYLNSAGIWASPIMPLPVLEFPAGAANRNEEDSRLRSIREVIGYAVEAADGEIGKVDDFIADDKTWNICFLVVTTHNWLPRRKVLLFPEWVTGRIHWSDQTMKTFVSCETIRNSPDFDSKVPISREYEARLYQYYGRPAHWQSRPGTHNKGMNAIGS